MSQTNALAGSVLVRPNIGQGIVDATSRPTDLFDFCLANGLVQPLRGGSPFKWGVKTSGNSSAETFVEGQALPASGRRTLVQASQSVTYFRARAGISGHLRDNLRNGNVVEADAWAGELADAQQAVLYLAESSFLGSTADLGIASIVDAGDTYAGIAPGSYSAWASLETAVGGAMTAGVLMDAYEAITGGTYMASPSVILCNVNQLSNYAAIAGPGSGTSSQTRMMLPASAPGAYDIGVTRAGVQQFNGIPLVGIRGMTTTEVYFLDLNAQNLGNGVVVPGLSIQIHRDMQVDLLGKTSDSDDAQVSMAAMLMVANRRRQAKLTGVTA